MAEEALGTTKSASTVKSKCLLRRHSLPLFPSDLGKDVPNYLRASGGSCHDHCKYGRRETAEVKQNIPRIRRPLTAGGLKASDKSKARQDDPVKMRKVQFLPDNKKSEASSKQSVPREKVPKASESVPKSVEGLSINAGVKRSAIAKPSVSPTHLKMAARHKPLSSLSPHRVRPVTKVRPLSSSSPHCVRPVTKARPLSSSSPHRVRPGTKARPLSSSSPHHVRPVTKARPLSSSSPHRVRPVSKRPLSSSSPHRVRPVTKARPLSSSSPIRVRPVTKARPHSSPTKLKPTSLRAKSPSSIGSMKLKNAPVKTSPPSVPSRSVSSKKTINIRSQIVQKGKSSKVQVTEAVATRVGSVSPNYYSASNTEKKDLQLENLVEAETVVTKEPSDKNEEDLCHETEIAETKELSEKNEEDHESEISETKEFSDKNEEDSSHETEIAEPKEISQKNEEDHESEISETRELSDKDEEDSSHELEIAELKELSEKNEEDHESEISETRELSDKIEEDSSHELEIAELKELSEKNEEDHESETREFSDKKEEDSSHEPEIAELKDLSEKNEENLSQETEIAEMDELSEKNEEDSIHKTEIAVTKELSEKKEDSSHETEIADTKESSEKDKDDSSKETELQNQEVTYADEVPVKTLYVIEMDPGNQTQPASDAEEEIPDAETLASPSPLDAPSSPVSIDVSIMTTQPQTSLNALTNTDTAMSCAGQETPDTQALPSLSPANSPKSQSSLMGSNGPSHYEVSIDGSVYTDSEDGYSSYEDDPVVEEENLKAGVDGIKVKKSSRVTTEDNGKDPVKLKFRRGRVIEISEENQGPRRLKFRRAKVLDEKAAKDFVRKSSFKIAEPTQVNANMDNSTESVVLRHQDVQDKKDAQGLLNNVIEETASKLVGKRKSMVKALVGAFETVILLQDGKPVTTVED